LNSEYFFQLHKKREVSSAFCECIAGVAGFCKYISAVVIAKALLEISENRVNYFMDVIILGKPTDRARPTLVTPNKNISDFGLSPLLAKNPKIAIS
jgi:hypothetical protein